jgi:hypothetical protein
VSAAAVSVSGIGGEVHGGSQPIAGATVQLWTVGTSGAGSAATLLASVMTNQSGGFSLASAGVPLFSCTNTTEVYLTATGGNPGSYTGNSDIALMAVLGPCGGITSGTTIVINELTTVAAVAALGPYMTSYNSVGAPQGDPGAITNAFGIAEVLASTSTGTSPGAGGTVGVFSSTAPTALMNTLADIVASCVNSAGGAAGSDSPCGRFLSMATPTGQNTPPTNTIAALLNLYNNPTLHAGDLFGLVTTSGPFQPTLTQPPSTFAIGPLIPFGTVAIGAQSVVTLTSPNPPVAGPPNSLSGTLSGPNASDFSVSYCLARATACNLPITFSPSGAGTRTATLTLNWASYGDDTYTATYLLQGTGTTTLSPLLTMTPTNFGNMWIDVPWIEVVTLTNTGTTTLNLSAPTFSGTNAQEFGYYTPLCTTLTVGATCSFQLKVTPTTPGAQTTNVVFADSISGTNLTIPVQDNVVVPPTASPTTLVFPATPLNGSSAPQSFTVTSYLNHPVSATYGAGDGSTTPSFTLTKNSCVQGESPCLITAVFHPTKSGSLTDSITLTDVTTGVTSLATLQLQGTGGVGMAGVSTSSLNFTTATGSTSAAQAVILSNTGQIAFAISSIGLGGTNANEFTETTNCGSSLAVNMSCLINVKFAPQTPGSKTASVTISGDASAGLPLSVSLSGTAQ